MVQTITPTIVTLNTVVTVSPTPSQLQQSGALISVGGTTLTTGTYQFCGQLSDLEAILSSSGNYVELNAMGTTFFAEGNAVGFYVLELGTQSTVDAAITALATWITNNPGEFYSYLVPADWDIPVASISGSISATTLTVSAVHSGTVAIGQLVSGTSVSANTYITAGSGTSWTVSVSQTVSSETLTLSNPCVSLAADYANPTGLTYFFITTSAGNIANYENQKSVFAVVPSPTAASSEFQAASAFYQWLVNNPGPANQLAPMAYRYIFGVTPWSRSGNNSTINTILTAYGNLILTGSEGGISDSALFKGNLMDGSQSSWWYGIDWFQIQSKQALAAAVLNGSNSNPPLLFGQIGINSLLAVLHQVAVDAVTFGCAQSISITAIPFATYIAENPDDYQAGIYNGFQATVVGQNGFLTLTFNIDAVEFA